MKPKQQAVFLQMETHYMNECIFCHCTGQHYTSESEDSHTRTNLELCQTTLTALWMEAEKQLQ